MSLDGWKGAARRARSVLSSLASALLLAACATTTGSPLATITPVVDALTRPTDELEAAAKAGEAKAQYGLAVLAADGLRGVAKDDQRAAMLRRSAVGMRGYTTITQYIPGINGAAGHVSLINIPRYDLDGARVAVMDRCVAVLKSRKLSTPDSAACGPPEVYDWLRQRWDGVDAPAPAAWRLATLSCTDQGAIAALWSLSARAFEAAEYATAARYDDRIIAACGDTEPSWHPRVMRALIAIADKEPGRATRLLGPVPKPAAAPIGSISSFVALAAAAGEKDWPRFAALRLALTQAVGLALTSRDGLARGRLIEHFAAGGAQVDAYEASIPNPRLSSHESFVVTPSAQGAWPMTLHLTSSPSASRAGEADWFVDEYRCDGRSTFKYFGPRKTAPPYAEVRAIVVERLTGRLQAVSGSQFNRGLEACRDAVWVAPGLPD